MTAKQLILWILSSLVRSVILSVSSGGSRGGAWSPLFWVKKKKKKHRMKKIQQGK